MEKQKDKKAELLNPIYKVWQEVPALLSLSPATFLLSVCPLNNQLIGLGKLEKVRILGHGLAFAFLRGVLVLRWVLTL